MQNGGARRTTVTLGPYYLNRRNSSGDRVSIGLTATVEFLGVPADVPGAARLLRARLAHVVESKQLNGTELPAMADRIFASFTDAGWTDGSGAAVPDRLRLRQLNLVTTDSASDAPTPVTVVTVSA